MPASVQPEASPADTNASAPADVFISYHPADKTWVRQTLLPLLEKQNGLRAIVDWRDFEIGVPKLTNIENAVLGSRSTLIVLTPEWVQSEWNAFQELLASTTDPSGVQRKLLPVMLRACTPPPRIAMRDYADLTNPDERDEQLQRLVRSLKPRQLKGVSASAVPTAPAPTSTADFVIITALEEERNALLNKLPGIRKLAPSKQDVRVYYSTEIPVQFSDHSNGSYHVVLTTLSSMGRVNAAAVASDAIYRWQPRYVLMVGIAGGISEANVKLGDILISNQIVDFEQQKLTDFGPEIRWEVHRVDPALLAAVSDFPYSLWGKEIMASRPGPSDPNIHIGPIASGDKVIAFQDVLTRYRNYWPKLIGVEMEGGGVATAAFQSIHQPGFFMIRGVSDLADAKKGSRNVEKWRLYACDVAAAYTVALLKSGPVPVK